MGSKNPTKMEVATADIKKALTESMNKFEASLNAKFSDMNLLITTMENGLKTKIGELEIKINDLEKIINENKAIDAPKTFADIVRGTDVSRHIANATVKAIGISESRDKNLMIYNVKEAESIDASERMDHKQDALKVLNQCKVDFNDSDILKVTRIGAKVSEDAEKPRPIRVTLKTKELRDKIVEGSISLSKIKDNRSRVAPDRSPEERNEVKALVKEAEKRNLDTEHSDHPKNGWKWVVVGKLHPRLKMIMEKKEKKEENVTEETSLVGT